MVVMTGGRAVSWFCSCHLVEMLTLLGELDSRVVVSDVGSGHSWLPPSADLRAARRRFGKRWLMVSLRGIVVVIWGTVCGPL